MTNVVQIVRVEPVDPIEVETEFVVGEIERLVSLDLHQRILITRAIRRYGDRMAWNPGDPLP